MKSNHFLAATSKYSICHSQLRSVRPPHPKDNHSHLPTSKPQNAYSLRWHRFSNSKNSHFPSTTSTPQGVPLTLHRKCKFHQSTNKKLPSTTSKPQDGLLSQPEHKRHKKPLNIHFIWPIEEEKVILVQPTEEQNPTTPLEWAEEGGCAIVCTQSEEESPCAFRWMYGQE